MRTRAEKSIFDEMLADDDILGVTLRALTADEPESYPLGELKIAQPVCEISSEQQEWRIQGTFLGRSWDYTVTLLIEKKHVLASV